MILQVTENNHRDIWCLLPLARGERQYTPEWLNRESSSERLCFSLAARVQDCQEAEPPDTRLATDLYPIFFVR